MDAPGSARGDLAQVRSDWASKVKTSLNDLLEEEVLVFELTLKHADVHKDLSNESLKLKFQMNGVTYLKSKASKAAVNGGEHLRINLDTAGHAVFEGAKTLDFELCKPRYFRRSRSLATCQVPLRKALRSMHGGSTHASAWNLELQAVGTSNQALGSLAVDVHVRTSKLHAAGGLAALKAIKVSRPPTSLQTTGVGRNNGLGANQEATACADFVSEATKAKRRLREAFDATQRQTKLPTLREESAADAPPKIVEEEVPDAAHAP
mmetsp:Transcript_142797/g.397781  ORF Transcript_142797/g.397781 Transcript_142797/m.397781 type:complete len:264 (-) Transcript_142797:261-1052(-)